MTIRTKKALSVTAGDLVNEELWLEVYYTIRALNVKVCEVHGVKVTCEIRYNHPDFVEREIDGWKEELQKRRDAWEQMKLHIDGRFRQLEATAK